MFNYPFTKNCDFYKLIDEIGAAGIPMMSMDILNDTQCIVNTAVALTNPQLATLNQVVASHVKMSSLTELVTNRIMAARNFGISLIARYGAMNVLSGYSIETIQDIMTKTAKVQVALNTGSLYVAIQELNAIETDGVIITADKIKVFRNQIEDYLQIPRT